MSSFRPIGIEGGSFEELPHEAIQKRLREHPDCIEIEFAGQKVPYFIGKYSFDLIREQGFDPGEIFPFDKTEEELLEEGIEGHSGRAAKMLWGGLVTFDHELELNEVAYLMSTSEMTGLYRQIVRHALSVDVPGVGAEGNGQGESSPSGPTTDS